MKQTIFDNLKKDGFYRLIRNGRVLGRPDIAFVKFLGRLPLYGGGGEREVLGIFEIIENKTGVYNSFPDRIMYLTENLSNDGITLEEISEEDMKVELI